MRSRPEPTALLTDWPVRRLSGLAGAVAACARDGAFLAALREVHGRADAAVDEAAATCLGGGACCRFDLAGHRLYASAGELALLVAERPPQPQRVRRGRCPYQVGPMCTARRNRPLGCRLHFCRGPAVEGLKATYEHLHGLIRRLHERRGLAYAYAELTAALAEVLGVL